MKQMWPARTQNALDQERDRRELAAIIERYADVDASSGLAIPELSFYRRTSPGDPVFGVYQPLLALVVQGAKQVVLADEVYTYDQARYLLIAIDLPVISRVVRATPEEPYLCLTLALDGRRVGELMAEIAHPKVCGVGRGLSVSRLDGALQDAVLRLVRLLDTPRDIPVLAPLIEREILYRLLIGEQGMMLRHIAMTDGRTHQIARAIEWLKENFAEPVRIEALARVVNMSPSSLHHHFKQITAMSPLQYQKRLRLQEARRLMLTERLDAASAGHQVGYDSPSQFSREYSRLYGTPPRQDVLKIQTLAAPLLVVGEE